MAAALVEILVAPLILLLRHVDADVSVVRREGRGVAVDAEIAALLEHARGEERRQHARHVVVLCLEGSVERGLAQGVGLAFEQVHVLVCEAAGGIFKHIALVVVEGSPAAREVHFHTGFQVFGGVAYQPAGRDVGADVAGRDGGLVVELQVDDDVVGFDRLDLDGLVPGLAAGRHRDLPVAGRGVGRGGEGEAVHAVVTGVADQRADGLALRVAEHRRHGVSGGQDAFIEHRDEGDVDVVAGAPDAAFTEDEAFLPLARSIAVHLEAAHRHGAAVVERDIRLVGALAHDGGAGLVVDHVAGEAAARRGGSFPYYLVHGVVESDLRTGDRLRREDVSHEDRVLTLVGALGDDRKVGHQDVAHAIAVVVVAAEIVIALVVILIEFGERIDAADLDAVDRAALDLHQVGHVQAVAVEIAELG